MNILTLLNQPMGGCEYYRQFMPHIDLKTKGHGVIFTNSILEKHIPFDKIADTSVFQIIRRDDLGMIRKAKEYGFPVIFDIDDYWNLDTTHGLYNYYLERNFQKHVKECMIISDMVTTTNELLAEKIRPYNSNVHVINNVINPSEKQFNYYDKEDDGKINIGYVAGTHHVQDVDMLRNSFARLWDDKELKGKFRVIYGGFQPDSEAHKYMAWILSGRDLRSDFVEIPATDVRNFAMMYDTCDIMIAPLKDTTFNRCKSSLKIIEAGYKKKSIVCSNVYPYNEDVVDGYDGFLIDQNKAHKQWYEVLRELILDRSKVSVMGERLHKSINDKYNFEVEQQKRISLYQTLVK